VKGHVAAGWGGELNAAVEGCGRRISWQFVAKPAEDVHVPRASIGYLRK